jgi:hypothetical protein
MVKLYSGVHSGLVFDHGIVLCSYLFLLLSRLGVHCGLVFDHGILVQYLFLLLSRLSRCTQWSGI